MITGKNQIGSQLLASSGKIFKTFNPQRNVENSWQITMPTGVEVCPAMVHGGPYPSYSNSRFTAVGIDAIKRWFRQFSYQNWPENKLPEALQNANPLGLIRLVNNIQTNDTI